MDMDKSYLMVALMILAVILIVVCLVKKAIKFAMFILLVILAIALVDILVYGVSPVDEFNAFVTNIKYGKTIATMTGDIKDSVGNISKALGDEKLDQEDIKTLEEENQKLHKYKEELTKLDHSKRLTNFHNSYMGYLDTIINISDGVVKEAATGKTTVTDLQGKLGQIKEAINSLTSLKK
jgi:hypothetical protein